MEGVGEGPHAPRRGGSVYFELLVTVGLFAIPATVRASWVALYGLPLLDQSEFRFTNLVVEELLIVALVAHIVRLHGERLSDFTRPPRWSDLGWAGLVFLAAGLLQASTVVGIGLARGMQLETLALPQKLAMFTVPISWSYVALVLVNPICEETLLRGFLQTRLRQVGWSCAAIVVASAGIQAAYHVYQGAPRALGIALAMALWAWFYERTRRLWPLIAAHTIADVVTMLTSSVARSG